VLKRTMHLIPRRINRHALAEAERWTRARMQGDGGIGAIYPAMANAVMALKPWDTATTTPITGADWRPSIT